MDEKSLTPRQQEFLRQFLAVYQELGEAVHYTTLAERLGVGKVTAYEMLRLLEERGLARKEYQPNPEQHGPGRSPVAFAPTSLAVQLLRRQPPESAELEDWRTLRDRLLQQLSECSRSNYENLLHDLFSHLPDSRTPMNYVTELTAAMMLSVASIQEWPEVRALMENLRRIGLPGEISLSSLSGVSLALSTLGQMKSRFSASLMANVGKYETMLAQISEENRLHLNDFARQITHILTS